MKIELKKIAVYERMSEETTAFNAEIYADGINIGYAKNDGQGGCTFYHAHQGKQDLMAKAEAYAKTLPPIQYELGEGRKGEIAMNLEHLIDELVEQYLQTKENAKFAKKREKAYLTNIVFGKPNGTSYKSIGWKITIAEICNMKGGEDKIKEVIAKVKKDLKEGEKILNTNLPIEWIK